MTKGSGGCPGPYNGKRVFDLVVLALIFAPAASVGVCCALAIRLTSRGSVIFRQERVGLGGMPFELMKFRTMYDSVGGNSIFPNPGLITRPGRWLRRLSLDELPQLINVARGEMSIVGPRPTLRYQVDRYSEEQRLRLAVRPGLTGLAQVRGRNEIAWPVRIQHDLEYVERQSLPLDLWILVLSVRAIAAGGGVGGHPTDDPLSRISE